MNLQPTHASRSVIAFVAATLLLISGPELAAQEAPPPCSSFRHAQFDFWIGEWEVFQDGEKAGENTIRRSMDGCVIHERYHSTRSDYRGESFNLYDARRGVWHQSWVDNRGLLLQLDGGLEDESMILEGAILDPSGRELLQRITWSRIDEDPDRVRQLWEQSDDGGESWEVRFDGTYIRVK